MNYDQIKHASCVTFWGVTYDPHLWAVWPTRALWPSPIASEGVAALANQQARVLALAWIGARGPSPMANEGRDTLARTSKGRWPLPMTDDGRLATLPAHNWGKKSNKNSEIFFINAGYLTLPTKRLFKINYLG